MKFDILYVDILPYSEVIKLNEDNKILGKNIKKATEYKDYVRARKELCAILAEPCERIEKLDYIKYCQPNPSDDTSKPGLSVYMNLMFNPPEGLTKEEIDSKYKYSIRFSDHKDKHKTIGRKQIKLVGKNVDSLPDTAWSIFNSELITFQDIIRDFEIEKFGEQKTFITDEKPKEQNSSIDTTTESFKLTIAESPVTTFRRSVGAWNPKTIGYDFDDIIFSLKDRNKISAWSDYIEDIMWFIDTARADYDFCASVNDCDKVKLLTWLQKKKPTTREDTIKFVKKYLERYDNGVNL